MSSIFPEADGGGGIPPLSPYAKIISGFTRRGKSCRLIDNTGAADPEDLQKLLEDLISQDHFRHLGLSAAGGNAIRLDAPQTAHVQLGERLYRLVVMDSEARLEAF